MKTRKFIKSVFISVGIIGFLFSCKKENKEDTVVHFHLYNPVTNEAYSGIKVAVYEQKDVTSVLKLQNEYESNKIWNRMKYRAGSRTAFSNQLTSSLEEYMDKDL